MTKDTLDGAVILLTGGTGSFGTEFTRVVLREYNPRALRILSRGEFLQSEMARKFNDDRLRFFIGDVRDRNRLYRAMDGVDVCIAAAALKQIPTAEYNPMEASNTNIDGAENTINAALDDGVGNVIFLSTDKVCQPTTLYGATKLVAEKLFVQANAYVGRKRTRFACTRYGNVLMSRGSVVPLFKDQRKSGVLTITDERMTRFWLTLEQGVRFVIRCLNEMQGGEVFIPKIKSMKIIDMADAIAPEARKRIIGIRLGEKLHETLMTEEESAHAIEFEDHFVIVPQMSFWEDMKYEGTPAKIGRYSSDTNNRWLTKEELKRIIGNI